MARTIVDNMLKQMPAVGQPPRKFLVLLCSPILALRGRVNVRHLSRDWDDAERTIARQCRRSCDGPDVHHRVSTTGLDPPAEVRSAQEASGIPTSGPQPFGLGHCCHSGAGRAERGLERSPLAVVEGTHRGAVTRAVAQTPPPWATATTPDQEATLGDFDPPPRRAPQPRLPAWVASHAVDGYGAQKT
jgi:hypothetical protein